MTCARNPDGVLSADLGPAEVDDADPFAVTERAGGEPDTFAIAAACKDELCDGSCMTYPSASPALVDSPLGLPVEGTAAAPLLPIALIPCDVCGEPATVGFTSDEVAMASVPRSDGLSHEPEYLCDEHGCVGEEGGQELEQAEGVRLIGRSPAVFS